MKVLLTGAGGQVGSTLSATVPADVEVVAASRSALDVTDEQAVAASVARAKPDLIVNAAAYTAVDRAEEHPEEARRLNSLAPAYLARAALGCGARLLHLSTDYVFDGQSSTPYRPDSPTAPLSVYGRTKRAGEQAVIETLGPRAVVLRTSWIYAAVGKNFLLTMLRRLKEPTPARVVADQIGTPTAARSIADICWAIARRDDVNGLHHWTDAGVASWFDFAVAIAEEAQAAGLLASPAQIIPITTAEYPLPAKRPRYSVMDKSSLITALGRYPVHWRERLRSVLKEIARA